MKLSREKWIPYSFLLPFLVVSVIFTLIPMLYSLSISFQDYSFLNPAASTFVGFGNYQAILHDKVFLTALANTFKYLLAVVPLLIAISLGLAVLLNEQLCFRGFFRSAFYLPYVVSPMAMGVIAVQLFSKNSLVAQLSALLGSDPFSWHTKAPYAFWLIVIVIVWSQIGFYMVLYLTGLQNIPAQLYEAARIDGANRWRLFRHITLPQLSNTTVLVLFMCILSTMQVFDQPYVISTTGLSTPGSPGDTTLSMVMYIYMKAFRYREIGPASAAAFIVFCIIFAASTVQNITTRRREE